MEINIGDDLVDRWGNTYEDIIETVSFVDTKRKEIGDVDSLVTLFTNDVVGYIDNDSQEPEDFYVTKTEFISNRTGDDGQRICLLYTSPSPRDLSTSRMPSSA